MLLDPYSRYGANARIAGRAERDAAFRRLVDETKDRHNISDIAALDRKVRKVQKAGEFVALCAFHSERTPSMRLNDVKGTYHCFGCGESGDILKYVRQTRGLGFRDALSWLGAADLPAVDHAARAKAVEEDAAERLAAIEEARAMWERCFPAAGTVAETYARSRGIVASLPDSIRFGMVYAWRDSETGEVGPDRPAMVAAVVDAQGEMTGLQRTFLAKDGSGKAEMRKAKLSLGRIRGGALRLGPIAAEVITCEGGEDGLSLAQELPGASVWVSLGTGMMPEMAFPESVRSVVVAGQNDAPGRAVAEKASVAFAERGLDVRSMYPDPRFKDWNDQLRGIEL